MISYPETGSPTIYFLKIEPIATKDSHQMMSGIYAVYVVICGEPGQVNINPQAVPEYQVIQTARSTTSS